MAFTLKSSICPINKCYQLQFTDETKPYSSLNTGGYGTPNIELTDITAATVAVYLPNTVTPVIVNVYINGVFPNTNNVPFTITNVMLGFDATEPLPSGKYKIVYTVSGTDFNYSISCFTYVLCNEKLCIKNKALSIDYDCDCSVNDRNTLLQMNLLYNSIKLAAECGNINSADNMLLVLQKMCKLTKCDNC